MPAPQLHRTLLACALLALAASPLAHAGRFEDFTKRAAQGPKLNPVAATFYGSDGIEDFVSAAELPDGTIVALGNTWQPENNPAAKPIVLGKGTFKKIEPYSTDPKSKKQTLREDNPIIAGTLVFYAPGLKSIKKVVRFDFGVASITAAIPSRDGKSLFIAGRSTENLRSLNPAATKIEPADPASKGTGSYTVDGVTAPGDVYLARFNPDTNKLDWVCIFAGKRNPPDQLWTDKQGNIYGDFRGMVITSPDGKTPRRMPNAPTAEGPRRYLGIDPATGYYLYGGDRNTNTGREPYRGIL